MKNLFEAGRAQEVKERLARLREDSPRQWGRMSAAQAVAHCAIALEWAVRDRTPDRMWLLPRMIGRVVKPMALGNDDPMKRNSPTVKSLIIPDERPLDTERQRLCELIDRFVAGGSMACTAEQHPFFGKMTPEEWAILTYKHLDHHLRQFGV
jgi:Protein of unknown function (DUF1569)